MKKTIILASLFFLLSSCEEKQKETSKIAQEDIPKSIPQEIIKFPEQPLNELLGKTITIKGMALNQKLGAVLQCENYKIWMKDLSGWPKGYYTGGDKGKEVIVTGTVTEAHDLPVFISKNNDVVPAGIAVPEGTNLNEARHRYLLENASWE
jgi:hypothetical protein